MDIYAFLDGLLDKSLFGCLPFPILNLFHWLSAETCLVHDLVCSLHFGTDTITWLAVTTYLQCLVDF